jgi:MFS family permease
VKPHRNRRFVLFWCAQTLSAAGDAMALVALPLLVLDATGSVAQLGLLTASETVGYVVAGGFSGVVVDRFDRRRLMICSAALQAAVYLLVPLVWLVAPQVWLLYVVVPAGAVLGMTFQVSYVTVVPALVDSSEITAANGALQSGFAAAGIGGSALGGILCAVVGPPVAIALDAATFAISAGAMVVLRFDGPPGTREAMRWSDYLAGARFLWRTPVLRALTILLSVQTFFSLGITDLLIFHLRHDLGRSGAVVGYVLTATAVGSLVAGACVAVLNRRLGFAACWIGAGVVSGVCAALLGYAGSAVAVAALGAGFTGCMMLSATSSMSLRQRITPDHLLGRVTSAFWMTHYALSPIGAAVLTALAGRYSVAGVCLVSGTVYAATALAGRCTAIAEPGRTAEGQRPDLRPPAEAPRSPQP